MARLHFSAMLLVVFATAAVWSYPQVSTEPGLPSSTSSSENPQVYDAVNNEKLEDVLQYEQLHYDDSTTSDNESVRTKRERYLSNAERMAQEARQRAIANLQANARRAAAQQAAQRAAQQAAQREAQRRDMNNNHRLLNEMQNRWNNRN